MESSNIMSYVTTLSFHLSNFELSKLGNAKLKKNLHLLLVYLHFLFHPAGNLIAHDCAWLRMSDVTTKTILRQIATFCTDKHAWTNCFNECLSYAKYLISWLLISCFYYTIISIHFFTIYCIIYLRNSQREFIKVVECIKLIGCCFTNM